MATKHKRNAGYFIKGTIVVHYYDIKFRVSVAPSAGFLSPDKKFAVAYPTPSMPCKKAKLIKALDQQIECKVLKSKKWGPALIAGATKHLLIELKLRQGKRNRWTIVGFKFPSHS